MSRRTLLSAVAALAAAPAVAEASAPRRHLWSPTIDWSGPVLPASDVELTPAELEALQVHPTPDAGLLALCAEHVRLAEEDHRLLLVMRSFDVHDESDEAEAAEAAWDASGAVTHKVLERIVEMQATTLAGAAAKGRSVLIYLRSLDNPGETNATRNYTDVAARAVLADLERMAGDAA